VSERDTKEQKALNFIKLVSMQVLRAVKCFVARWTNYLKASITLIYSSAASFYITLLRTSTSL
jgi:hypothetical protein